MAARPFIVGPENYADTLDIVGEHVTVLASGEATEGYEISSSSVVPRAVAHRPSVIPRTSRSMS